jgi:hypothetical protein
LKQRIAAAVIVTAAITGTTEITVTTAAAAAPSVRTYSETASITLTGLGRHASFLDHRYRSQQVILSPSLSYYRVSRNDSISLQGKETITKGQFYLVGGSDYAELNGVKTWTVTPATPGELRGDAVALNPADGLARFRAIRGATLTAPRQHQVACTPGQAGAFLALEFGLSTRDLASAGIKLVTITLLTDSAGRPLTYTVVAKSKLEKLAITETFTGYNQPLTITAPA